MASVTNGFSANGTAANGITEGYRRYALGVFVVVYVTNFIDRQIFSILIEPIKAEIVLSDTQIGLLGGIAFAIFYTFAGIPIARWADVGVRKNIIALAILVWSVMTMVTSTARSFTALLIARIGVGVGEAGCSPPIHSLISDYFPEDRRATALSTYALGIPIGGAIGVLAGGWIGEYFGWRAAFVVVGLPGILLSLIVFLTIREPPRGLSDRVPQAARKDAVPLEQTLRFIGGLRAFRHLAFAGSLHGMVAYGVALFLPSYFMRAHGFGLAEASTYLFLIGLTGMVGTYLGGYLSDQLTPKDRRWYVGVPGIATLLSIPLSVLFYSSEHPYWVLVLAVPPAILGPVYTGPTFAVTQLLVPPAMRSLASAILLFVLNLIGLGLGPLVAGMASDSLQPVYGNESIRYSLLLMAVIGNGWATLHYYLASRTLATDLAARDRIS